MGFLDRGRWLRIGAIFLAWTACGLFYLTQDLIRSKIFFRDPTPWWHYLLTWLSGVYLTAACTPLLLWLGCRFDPDCFLRIHRSIIVNIGRIKELEPALHGEYVVTLETGVRLRSGRTYHEKLKALAGNPF